MVCDGPRPPLYRQFLDQGQYSSSSIQQYEKIYGTGYVSIGGAAMTASLLPLLQLAPGQRVLEVGSGPGGECALRWAWCKEAKAGQQFQTCQAEYGHSRSTCNSTSITSSAAARAGTSSVVVSCRR